MRCALSIVAGMLIGFTPYLTWAQQSFITIGTGGVTGVYYPVGASICRLVNRERNEHDIRCSVESTAGSVYNLDGIHAGELDFGVVQSDWQYHAYNGTSRFEEKGPYKKLRAVFSLHPEPFTVVARSDSGIKHFDDLKGKRVNVGNPGSGHRGTMEVIMEAKGWTMNDLALASEFKSAEQAKALCDNKIDAFVFAVGHPSDSIQEATATCDGRLVEVSGPVIERLVRERPYYSWAIIPGGIYANNPNDTKTFGVRATLVSSTRMAPDVVQNLVKTVFDNFSFFMSLHAAFRVLDKEEMVTQSLSAPLHEGAETYYRAAGLL